MHRSGGGTTSNLKTHQDRHDEDAIGKSGSGVKKESTCSKNKFYEPRALKMHASLINLIVKGKMAMNQVASEGLRELLGEAAPW